MEEQNKNGLQETETDDGSAQDEQAGKIPEAGRRFIIWVLGGVYLLYTGYSLCKSVLDGAEGASTGFFVAGLIFAVIGAVLLIFSAKSMWTEDKMKKAREAELAKMQQTSGNDSETTDAATEKKSMSISERANLTKRLDDEE